MDWGQLVRDGVDTTPLLTVRGRNLRFVNRIADALQLDRLEPRFSLKHYKAAFTAEAVRRIHEAVLELWPPDMDVAGVLGTLAGDVSGLYVGYYDVAHVYRALVRN